MKKLQQQTSFKCAGQELSVEQPLVMGILNVTPDSFSDGGLYRDTDAAVEHALQMEKEGAAIIDIGGESTRPDAEAVSAEQELERVIPVIEILQNELSIPISIDTSKPEVMQVAVAAGAKMINDVRALQLPGALEIAAQLEVPVCLMHMQGEPHLMQQKPYYEDIIGEINQFFYQRLQVCEQAGISPERIILDPGFGFGKTWQHNYHLLAHLDEFTKLGHIVLAGLSRKSMIGAVLDRATDERLPSSLALAVLAVNNGAAIIRAHDVSATIDALKMVTIMKQEA